MNNDKEVKGDDKKRGWPKEHDDIKRRIARRA